MKVNIKGFIALFVMIFVIGFIAYDFIQLVKGGTYTLYGIATLILVIYVGYLSSSYIEARLKR